MPQQRIGSTARTLSSTDTDRNPRQTGCPQLVASYDTQEDTLGLFYTPGPTGGLFWVLRRFQHCTGHITTGSWKGRGNQYIQFARVLYCKLPTNGKQLPAFPLEAVTGIEPRPQRWEARVLPLCHRGPCTIMKTLLLNHYSLKSWGQFHKRT